MLRAIKSLLYQTLNLAKISKMQLFNSFLELLYPPLCVLCRTEWKASASNTNQTIGICLQCRNKLANVCENYCPKCGLPVGGEANAKDCKTCRGRSIHYDQLLFVNEYKTYLGDLILQYKYGKDRLLGYFFADWMFEKIKDEYCNIDLVTSVPMYWVKKLKRGINQTELLGYEIAKKMKIAYRPNLLGRHKSDHSQAGQSRTLRYRSVKDL